MDRPDPAGSLPEALGDAYKGGVAMGSRVVHAEDDVGGRLTFGPWEDDEWACDCGASTVYLDADNARVEVRGVMWLRLGQALVCSDCGYACRISPTINFIGTRDQRPNRNVGGFVTDDDDDEMLWEDDDDDDIAWD